MPNFYATTGIGTQKGDIPTLPLADHRSYLLIEAPDEEVARALAQALLGSNWAGIYDEVSFQDRTYNYRLAGRVTLTPRMTEGM